MNGQKFLNGFQNVKTQIQNQGQEMEDRKIMENFIFPHFITAFEETQSEVFELYDVEEEVYLFIYLFIIIVIIFFILKILFRILKRLIIFYI